MGVESPRKAGPLAVTAFAFIDALQHSTKRQATAATVEEMVRAHVVKRPARKQRGLVQTIQRVHKPSRS